MTVTMHTETYAQATGGKRLSGGDTLGWACGLVFAAVFLLWWPCKTVFDDGGIVLKYLDNFAAGHFYAYNAEDGPMFGISGFLFGVLAGGLAWTGWLTPDRSAQVVNVVGIWLAASTTLLIVRHFAKSWVVAAAGWGLVMVSCRYLLSCTFQALEAPLHVGIAGLALLCFLRERRRMMWVCLALMIVSKLDGVPVAGALIVADGLRRSVRAGTWSVPSKADLLEASVWFGLPLAIWVGFCAVIFGTPMPHTAQAKLMMHQDASGAFFPFLWQWVHGDMTRFACAICLGVMAVVVRMRSGLRATDGIECGVFGWAFVCLMSLYFVYNPNEKMPWYYCLPEWLVAVQTVVALISVVGPEERDRPLSWRKVFACAGLGILLLANVDGTRKHLWNTAGYINRIEHERIAVGKWVRDHAAPGERLLTHSGHVARHSGLYVYDSTGLNSDKVLVAYREAKARGVGQAARPPDVVELEKPVWVAQTSMIPPATQEGFGYELVHSAYNMAAEGEFGAWRVFRRRGDGTNMATVAIPLAWESVLCDDSKSRGAYRQYTKAKGRCVILCGLGAMGAKRLAFGLRKADVPLRVQMRTLSADGGDLARQIVELGSRDRSDPLGGYVRAIDLILAHGADRIVVSAIGPLPTDVVAEVVDPVVWIPVSMDRGVIVEAE